MSLSSNFNALKTKLKPESLESSKECMSLVDWDEGRLIAACLGDESVSADGQTGSSLRAMAICEFVRRHRDWIFRLSYRLMHHVQDAEDVTQDVLVRAIKNLHRCDRDRSVRPWLTTITVNCCKTALKKRARQPRIYEELPISTLENHSRIGDDLGEELQRALDTLNPNYKTCFVLFYLQEHSCDEISTIMEVPIGTIKTWLYRARHELMTHLGRRNIWPEKIG